MKPLHPDIHAQAEVTARAHPDSLVSVFDLHGVWRFVSPAHTKHLGFEPDELLGHSYSEIIMPLDVPHARVATSDAELTGETQVTAQMRCKSGKVITVKGAGRRVTDPDTGQTFLLSISSVLPD